ncbi:MAG: hypothetical protein AVDCRST_MAG73-1617 [uncultured Thermomicrobiales bacterium]|uniref:Uncharacterized protein n=1 Tax=uncultured Thermomicrobiales bacterium TaxID=1645740 RepID=A0A6J4U1F3_9BACT|nr:MAG: hypothetical protein AVDCRST_MAG73-1617 [uncultured Thermomicrobiales bacterium]
MIADPTVLFLCGADMDPSAVLGVHPGARFVARARVVDPPPGLLPAWWPDAARADGVFGILIRVRDAGPTAPGDGPTVVAETDDGTPIVARCATGASDLADPAPTLAAARYWELRPAYVRAVASATRGDDAAS